MKNLINPGKTPETFGLLSALTSEFNSLRKKQQRKTRLIRGVEPIGIYVRRNPHRNNDVAIFFTRRFAHYRPNRLNNINRRVSRERNITASKEGTLTPLLKQRTLVRTRR